MAAKINPYHIVGTQLVNGMDEIAKSLSKNPTEEDLANIIYNYVAKLYSLQPSTQLELQVKSIVYSVINSYNNQKVLGTMFNYQQLYYVDMLLNEEIHTATPIDTIGTWLSNIEESVNSSALSVDEAKPLLLGTVCGKAIFEYWQKVVTDYGEWKKFLLPDKTQNYVNIPFWVSSCIEGALVGATCSEKGMMTPTCEIVSAEVISSLVGALTLGAGKVIFKWIANTSIDYYGFSSMQKEQYAISDKAINRKCKISGKNTCVNEGPCVNECTNSCTVYKLK